MRNPFGALFSRRSIGSSYELLQHLLRGSETLAGVYVNEAAALNVAAIWTGLQIRSSLLATLPIDVIESSSDGKTRTPQPNHPIARLLAKPNPFQTRGELVGMMETHRVFRGNCYAWKNLAVEGANDDGSPRVRIKELIPMHPDRVTVEEPKAFGAPTVYKLQRSNDAGYVEIPANEVLHIKNFSTNGRTGRGFMADLREIIGGSIAVQHEVNRLWSGAGMPAIALTHPKTLGGPGSTAQQNLETSWADIYGRDKEKRRVAVLEEGMDIKPLSLTPDDGQFLQTKQDLRAEIAAALMVPPHMMGLTEKVTSWGTGIEQQQIGLLVFTIAPSAFVWEERFNRDLIARPDRFAVKFNVKGFLRGDSRSQAESFWMYRQMGVYSANDIRALLDLNPIEGGDIYLQPTNLAPLGFIPEPSRTGGNANA